MSAEVSNRNRSAILALAAAGLFVLPRPVTGPLPEEGVEHIAPGKAAMEGMHGFESIKGGKVELGGFVYVRVGEGFAVVRGLFGFATQSGCDGVPVRLRQALHQFNDMKCDCAHGFVDTAAADLMQGLWILAGSHQMTHDIAAQKNPGLLEAGERASGMVAPLGLDLLHDGEEGIIVRDAVRVEITAIGQALELPTGRGWLGRIRLRGSG